MRTSVKTLAIACSCAVAAAAASSWCLASAVCMFVNAASCASLLTLPFTTYTNTVALDPKSKSFNGR